MVRSLIYLTFYLLFMLSNHVVGSNRTNFENVQEKEEQTEYLKTFLFKIFSFFPFAPSVNDTGGASWAENTSANFREKKTINGPNVWDTPGLGENLFMKKNLNLKISWLCPYK